jgi:uncharacterized damage-inducible protein DinB
MLVLLRDLVAHKGHANAAFLRAVRQHDAAAADPAISDLLHHILLANRFWLLAIVGAPFVVDDEARPSASFDALIERYRAMQAQEEGWLGAATDADLGRRLEDAQIPGGACTVSQAFMQVCLHSQGHRAQCAKLLRRHGAVPPPSDFIAWLPTRAPADWP